MNRILLLEDDLSLINGLSFALKKQEFISVGAKENTKLRKKYLHRKRSD